MLILAKNKLYIDNIYWERVQLFIEGHAEGINIKEGDFLLRNLTETKELKANNVEISDNNFTCRFNVAILDNGVISYENSLENMKNKIKKIQIAFDEPVYEEDLNLKGIFKISKVGRVFTIITDEYDDEFIKGLNKFKPLFIEEVDLSLEDIFIYKVDKED